MVVRETAVLEEEPRDELLVEVEGSHEGLHMPQAELVIHEAELAVDDFGEQWDREVAVLVADLEVCILGLGLVPDDGDRFADLLHDGVVVDPLDDVVSHRLHRVLLLRRILVERHLEALLAKFVLLREVSPPQGESLVVCLAHQVLDVAGQLLFLAIHALMVVLDRDSTDLSHEGHDFALLDKLRHHLPREVLQAIPLKLFEYAQ